MYKESGYFREPLNTQQAIERSCTDVPPGTLISRGAVPPGLLVVRDYLPRPICAQLVAFADSQPSVPATVHNPGAHTPMPSAHESTIRVTDHIDIGAIAEQVNEFVRHALVNLAAPHYGERCEWFERPALLRYQPGGHYVPHADADHWDTEAKKWSRLRDRDLSLLLYLDDDFDGGELDFPNFRFRMKPQTGMLICFPSDHRYVHAAHEVTRGVRHVIVSWTATTGSVRVAAAPPDGVVTLAGQPG